jgi:hypothetical protein
MRKGQAAGAGGDGHGWRQGRAAKGSKKGSTTTGAVVAWKPMAGAVVSVLSSSIEGAICRQNSELDKLWGLARER